MTTVKTFDSTMSGAPVLSGTAGALINVVKTCLVDGFGSGPVQSLNVASNIATATYATGHPFRVGSIALIAGATPAALNGEKRVLSTTATTITFDATGVPDGAASGSITSKIAPAGWLQVFTGTNLSAFKSPAAESTGCVLRVDDTGTTTARVVGYESMSSISDGVKPFPTSTQVSGGLYWAKSTAASTAARAWVLVADTRTFYLLVVPAAADFSYAGVVYGFGDFSPLKSGDAYAAFLTGSTGSTPQTTASAGCLSYGQPTASVATAELVIPRAYTMVGGAQIAWKTSALNTAVGYSGTSGYAATAVPYPNGPDNGLLTSEVLMLSTGGVRGVLRGLLHTPQTVGASFSTLDALAGSAALVGRSLLALRAGAPASAASAATVGTVFIDQTGPWS